MPRFRVLCLVTSLAVASVVPAAAQTGAPAPDTRITQAPAQVEAPGVVDLLKDSLGDFRRLPSMEAATWLSLGAAAAAMGHTADTSMSSTMSGSKMLETLFAPGETVGGARFQLAGAVATYGVGRLTGHNRMAVFGAELVRANILAQAMTAGIKMAVRRGRPDGTEFSFPSGHTSVSFAAATVIKSNFGWKAGVPAYAAATFVAASRIQEKRHFLSDVAFGAVVGIVAGRTVTVGSRNHKFAVEPTIPHGGGVGISFTKR